MYIARDEEEEGVCHEGPFLEEIRAHTTTLHLFQSHRKVYVVLSDVIVAIAGGGPSAEEVASGTIGA